MIPFALPSLYTLGGMALGWLASGGADKIASTIVPVFEDQVEVTVHGNRASTRKQLYALALSLAFGKVKPQNLAGSAFPPGMIAMTYDCVEKVVKVIIHYKYSGMTNITGGIKPNRNVIFTGPEDISVGGPWSYNSIGIAAKDVVGSTLSTGGAVSPVLPVGTSVRKLGKPVSENIDPSINGSNGRINIDNLVGKEILTTADVRNPSPPNDNAMRGTYAERLAFQFLTNSCDDPLRGTTAAAITTAKQAKTIVGVAQNKTLGNPSQQ